MKVRAGGTGYVCVEDYRPAPCEQADLLAESDRGRASIARFAAIVRISFAPHLAGADGVPPPDIVLGRPSTVTIPGWWV